jgi:hypothetical protein
MLELNFKPFPIRSTKSLNLTEITENDAEEILFQPGIELPGFPDHNPSGSADQCRVHSLAQRNNFIRETYHKENYYYNAKFNDSAIYTLFNPIS